MPPRNRPLGKPPLGLAPKWVLNVRRRTEIKQAICRYFNANADIPLEWIEEYNELNKIIAQEEQNEEVL